MKNFYPTRKIADEVLKHYEKHLLRCFYVVYLAVVKKVYNGHDGFSIECGIQNIAIDIVKINQKLSDEDIISGKFSDNIIPYRLPVPPKIYNQLTDLEKNLVDSHTFQLEESVSRSKLDSMDFNWTESITHDAKEFNNKRRKRSNMLTSLQNFFFPTAEHPVQNSKSYMNGLEIYNKKERLPTTLGAIFKLIGYGDQLFGITNQHLFDYNGAALGDPVFNLNKKEIGTLFWLANDIRRDAAIIKLNNFFKKEYLKKYPFKGLNIGKPTEGLEVTHNGFRITSQTNRETADSCVVSINSTVRIFTNNDPEGWRIYRNQILIKENTLDGDSGASVFSKNNEILGLNFARTRKRRVINGDNYKINAYSVANNISHILNYSFPEIQEVFYKKKNSEITTVLSEKFQINNN